ncbi:hypothetical protein [Chloroflexus sp.]|uniref:hypothetical protein n=1 Tax=Chloroflexus sp. TaxID=1904827 RepID=UPI002617A423|nr:hypothetical protein [uncultured Chloroflexus sp.]
MTRIIVLGLIGVLIGATALAAAATIVIPAAAMDDINVAVSPQDIAPPACAGMGLSAIITGAGTIQGTAGNDLIVGSAGNDTIDGLGGNDCLIGGQGSDALIGGAGFDVCIGTGADPTCER